MLWIRRSYTLLSARIDGGLSTRTAAARTAAARTAAARTTARSAACAAARSSSTRNAAGSACYAARTATARSNSTTTCAAWRDHRATGATRRHATSTATGGAHASAASEWSVVVGGLLSGAGERRNQTEGNDCDLTHDIS
jgi:hypothetical protein